MVSLFASAVRPQLWPAMFKSLEGTSVEYEVVFAGDMQRNGWIWADGKQHVIGNDLYRYVGHKPDFKYIHTGRIKPAQCYEIARRHCTGEVVVWIADDCEFPNDVIGKAYAYWKSQNNEKLILSIQTKESGYNLPQGQLFDMNMHRFFGFRKDSPLMAPLGMMSRKFLNDLVGIDRRYVCGQYENDIVMRAYNEGGKVEIFGDKECFIDIDHLGKSILIGESKTQNDFLNRPFATGYAKDREILEASWTKNGKLYIENDKYVRFDKFEPFEDKDILEVSQSNRGKWV